MIVRQAIAAAAGLAMSLCAAHADVTVKMLHVEQNPQASGFWRTSRAVTWRPTPA
jgi:hypothetical protein